MELPLLRSEGRRMVVRMVVTGLQVGVVCSMVPAADVESQRMFGETEPDDDWKQPVPQEQRARMPPRVPQEQRVQTPRVPQV